MRPSRRRPRRSASAFRAAASFLLALHGPVPWPGSRCGGYVHAFSAVPGGGVRRRPRRPLVPMPASSAAHLSNLLRPDGEKVAVGQATEADVVPPPPPPQPPAKRKNFRMQLFSTLNLPIIEVFSTMAVLLSSFLVALKTLDHLPPEAVASIDDALLALNIIFAVDFFVRWYAAGQFKFKYLTKPLAVIDIVVVLLPLVLMSAMPVLDTSAIGIPTVGEKGAIGLQNLLLLRVLRLRRILTDINTFRRFVAALGLKPTDVRPYQLQLARVLLSIFTLLSVASGLIYTAEHDVNPDIPDYFAALYFGLTTLTTVGFGDIAPVTSQGRLVVCGSILAGVAIVPAQTAKLFDAIVEFQMDQEKRGKQQRGGIEFQMDQERKGKQRRGDSVSGAAAVSALGPTNRRTVDGKGRSGVDIEIPLMENQLDVLLRPQGGSDDSSSTASWGPTCRRCGASPHRADASFCWLCGSELGDVKAVDSTS